MTLANAKPDLLLTGPLGSSMVNAASSAWHDYLTVEAKITAASAYAASLGAKYCYVPDSFLPYTASLVTFNNAVIMTREGGHPGWYDVRAYGAAGNDTTDDTAALQATVAAAIADLTVGGVVFIPGGSYKLTSTLTLGTGIVLRGVSSRGARLSWAGTVGPMISISGALGCAVEDIQLDGNTIATSQCFFIGNQASYTSINRVFLSNWDTVVVTSGQCYFLAIRDAAIISTGVQTFNFGTSTNDVVLENVQGRSSRTTHTVLGTVANSSGYTIRGCEFEGQGIGELDFFNVQGVAITGCFWENVVSTIDHFLQFGTNGTQSIGVVLKGCLFTQGATQAVLIVNLLNADFRGNSWGTVKPMSVTGTLIGRKNIQYDVDQVPADRGDANVTLVNATDAYLQRFATTLTANRTVTLSTTDAWEGAKFRIVRTGLGAFTLDVGGLKTIPSATAAFVEVCYDSAAWRLIGYGPL